MKHQPHSSNVRKIAEMYEKYSRVYDNARVDMSSNHITRCRGVYRACAAGWITLGLVENDGSKAKWRPSPIDDQEEAYAPSTDADTSAPLRFEPGAEAIAKLLGFKGKRLIERVAACEAYYGDETELWGSRHGHFIFSAGRAYEHITDEEEKLTLSDLAHQWWEVEERTRRREEILAGLS